MRREFFRRLLMLFMVLWVLAFAMLCIRVVMMLLWHALMLLRIKHFGFSLPFHFVWWLPLLFLVGNSLLRHYDVPYYL
jgi:hypothetical protein